MIKYQIEKGVVNVVHIIEEKQNDFFDKSYEEQRELMIGWRNTLTNAEIMEYLDMKGAASFNKLIKSLNIPKKNKWNVTPKTLRPPEKVEPEIIPAQPILEKNVDNDNITKDLGNTLYLEYTGNFTKEQIINLFDLIEQMTGKTTINIAITVKD